jgi:hypothetical protein
LVTISNIFFRIFYPAFREIFSQREPLAGAMRCASLKLAEEEVSWTTRWSRVPVHKVIQYIIQYAKEKEDWLLYMKEISF